MVHAKRIAMAAVLAVSCLLVGSVSAANGRLTENDASLSAGGVETFERARRLLDDNRGMTWELEAARVALTEVLEENPSYAPAYKEIARYIIMRGHLGSHRFRSGTLEAAEAALDKAVEIDPSYADAYVLYGHLYRLMKRHRKAEEALAKAERLGSKSPWLNVNWADIHLDLGRVEIAAMHYRMVLESGTRNKRAISTAQDGLINYYMVTRQYEKAEQMFRAQIAMEPDSAWSYGNYARFLLCTRDDYEAAIVRAREALARMDYGGGKFILASALYRKWAQRVVYDKRPRDAEPLLREAQSLYPDVARVAASIARCPGMAVLHLALQIAPFGRT